MTPTGRLNALRVVTPCEVPWSSMKGTGPVRFCGRCEKNVYDVARLGADEVLALVERTEGGPCLRLTYRADGTVVTGDCWAALRRARRRGLVALAAALPLIVLMQLGAIATGIRALFGRGSCPTRTMGEPLAPRLVMGAPPPAPVEPEARPKRHHRMGKMAPQHLMGRGAGPSNPLEGL
jgi:hypothetical protein